MCDVIVALPRSITNHPTSSSPIVFRCYRALVTSYPRRRILGAKDGARGEAPQETRGKTQGPNAALIPSFFLHAVSWVIIFHFRAILYFLTRSGSCFKKIFNVFVETRFSFTSSKNSDPRKCETAILPFLMSSFFTGDISQNRFFFHLCKIHIRQINLFSTRSSWCLADVVSESQNVTLTLVLKLRY